MFDVSVFGLGYVGCVTAACLAQKGHRVTGVDITPEKVAQLNDGMGTVREPGLDALVRESVRAGRLRATSHADEAVLRSSVSVICVGTPPRPNGSSDTSAIEHVAQEIGAALGQKEGRHLIVVRSTVLPGTCARLITPILERASGKREGVDFDVCMTPEFLRASSAIADFAAPPFMLVGTSSLAVAAAVQLLFAVKAPLRAVPLETAELTKFVFNTWRAVKVAFANEIGAVAQAVGVDGSDVMQLVCEDTRFNLSAAYLRPGFAFGGSCLPKDLRALVYRAHQADVDTPLLEGALASNARQVDRALALIAATGKRRVAVIGLTFKPGTDDLRESPGVALVERLLGKGYQLAVYDPELIGARLFGKNLAYIEREVPHLRRLLHEQLASAIAASDVVVVTRPTVSGRELAELVRPGQAVFDLARSVTADVPGARGLSW